MLGKIMVKLSFVEFKAPQKFENQTVTAVTGDSFGPLILDGFCIYVGKRGFPITDAKTWLAEEDKEKVLCPDCGEPCADKRGLGAHRYFKHQVEGIRPRKEK